MVVILVKRSILSRDKSMYISICINISFIHRHIDNIDAVYVAYRFYKHIISIYILMCV